LRPSCILFDLDNTLVDRPVSLSQYAARFASDFSDRLGEISIEVLDHEIQKNDGGGYIPKDVMFRQLESDLPWETRPTPEEIGTHWFSFYPQLTGGMPGYREVLEAIRKRDI
jgi:FMN phosphatase YigB (HAD superfamily)